MTLVEEDAMTLDQPVAPFAANDPHPSRGGVAITIRHLLGHTSGISDSTDLYDWGTPLTWPRTREAMYADAIGLPLCFTPSTAHTYSSTGCGLLGELIEQVSGQEDEACQRARILGPAGVETISLMRTLGLGITGSAGRR